MGKKMGVADTIAVCTGKACRKNKSEKLYENFESLLEDKGLSDSVCLKTCSCLKKCKKGPSIQLSPDDMVVAGLKPKKAEKYLEKILAGERIVKKKKK